MYVWFRDQIYDSRSLVGLYWICFVPLPLIVAVGMFASVKLDLRTNRDYEAGDLLRGVRILEPKEFARELQRLEVGVGLPALPPRRTEV
jgi:hypothetical protein